VVLRLLRVLADCLRVEPERFVVQRLLEVERREMSQSRTVVGVQGETCCESRSCAVKTVEVLVSKPEIIERQVVAGV
jgi:hypothetical protein